MIKQTESIDYHQLKQVKNLADFLCLIPEHYFEKILFGLLCFFCSSPVVVVALLNLGFTFFNPYFVLLQIGYVGMVFSLLLFYKRKVEKKTGETQNENFKQWILRNKIILCLGGVLIWGGLATLFSSDFKLSFFGDYYRREGLLTMGAYAGIFATATGIRSEKLKKLLIQIFALASFILGVIVLLQWLGLPIKSIYQFFIIDNVIFVYDEVDFILWAGIFDNTNHLGYYLTMGIMAAGGLFVLEKRKAVMVCYTLAFGLLTWVLVSNDTFGAYLGVCGGLLLFFLIRLYQKESVKRTLLLVVLFISISFLGNGLMGQVKTNFVILAGDVKNIIQVTNDSEALANQAGSGRWQLWKGAIEIIKENPVFGKGPDNLRAEFYKMGMQWDRPHNEMLQIGASLGIPAMILYLSALGLGYRECFKRLKEMNPTGIIALGAITGYLISAMFGNTMYYTYPYFLIFLALAINGFRGMRNLKN